VVSLPFAVSPACRICMYVLYCIVFLIKMQIIKLYRSMIEVVYIVCVVQAPCEAEAQCAALVKAGKVYAVGTEDMDALTFGSSVLLRHLTFSEARSVF